METPAAPAVPTEQVTPDKPPLEEQGHLSRTQLYIVAAILSLAVLGLVGYIAWDYFQTDTTTTTSTTSTTETEEEQEDTSEEENTDEETEEEVDTNVQLTPTQFIVEYWKGDGGVLDLTIGLPEGATISMDGTSATAYTTISYEDMTLTFGIPHFGLAETYSEYTAITNASTANLYRVKRAEGSYQYVNDIVLEGTCGHPTDTINAPCGAYIIQFTEQDGVAVTFDGETQSLTLADEMMATLEFAE